MSGDAVSFYQIAKELAAKGTMGHATTIIGKAVCVV